MDQPSSDRDPAAADDSPAEPVAPADQPARPASRRPRRRDLVAVALALTIGTASVLSAVVAWRASLASIDASRLQSLAVQEQARREQLTRRLEGVVAQDQRLVVSYQEHALAGRELLAQADALRDEDPEAADELDLQAQARMAQARGLQPFFQGASGVLLADDGSAVYDPAFVLRNLLEGNSELRELRPEQTLAQAQRADTRTVALIAVAALLVAALFFLTVAQTIRRRLPLRYAFGVVGGVLVAGGAVALVAVEFGA